MISVCIPTYNFDSSQLVLDLLQQTNGQHEVIVIDDASAKNTKENLRNIQNPEFTFIELEENVGRAKIRNLFLHYAKGDFLLFIDGDSTIIRSNFLSEYQKNIQENTTVICGASIYSAAYPPANYILRWKYGHQQEFISTQKRNERQSPLKTNNFLIRTDVFQDIHFDERITQYGHEDTLFGIELTKRKIQILHIDNPVLNEDLDTNEAFLKKTDLALDTLHTILNFYPNSKEIIQQIHLLRVSEKIKRFKLKWVIAMIYFFFGKMIKHHLLHSKNPSMQAFAFYKLAFFLKNTR